MFKPYHFGRPFAVVTDHHSLCLLFAIKDPANNLARWSLKLQQYGMTIFHKSVKKYRDAKFSRHSLGPRHREIPRTNCESRALSGNLFVLDKVDSVTEQPKNEALVPIMNHLLGDTKQLIIRVVQAARLHSIVDAYLCRLSYDKTGRGWLQVISFPAALL